MWRADLLGAEAVLPGHYHRRPPGRRAGLSQRLSRPHPPAYDRKAWALHAGCFARQPICDIGGAYAGRAPDYRRYRRQTGRHRAGPRAPARGPPPSSQPPRASRHDERVRRPMTAIPAAIRIPRVRWGIGVLLGAGVLINYFDRINLSVGAPQLQQEFGLTDGELGWLFSGFFWSYALLQIPTGMILDRFGVTSVYRISAFLWSLASGATALAGGFGGVLAARLLLGIAEGPGFPASAKATGYWFPRGERAMATSIFDAAAKFASVIGVPLVALAIVQFGWRWGFGITGMLSFLYFLAFLIVYRDPSRHPRLSSAERDYIRAGGATREGPAG